MPIVDVRAHLTDPANPKLTTSEINAMSLALVDPSMSPPDGPGGTLFFSAGDYWIQAMEEADLDPAMRTSPYAVSNANVVNHWAQGGIQIRPGVSYIGEPGTRLLWSETLESDHDEMNPNHNATMFGAVSPFAWESSAYVDAVITDTVLAGQRIFEVDSVTGFDIGDLVMLQLGYIPEDRPEFVWWTHATVIDIDDESPYHITLDHPAAIPVQSLDFGDPDAETAHLIRKLNRVIENIEIRNFELLQNPEPDPNPEVAVIQPETGIYFHYTRGTRAENLIATDVGAGAVVFQYCERGAVRNLHVKAATGSDYYGRCMSFANSRGITVDDVTLENFRSVPVFSELQSSQIRLRNLHLVNYNEDRAVGTTEGLLVTSFESTIDAEGLTVDGFGGYALTYAAGNPPLGTNIFSVDNLFLRPLKKVDGSGTSFYAYPARVQMRNLGGTVRHDRCYGDEAATGDVQLRQRFMQPRVWSQKIAIPVDDDAYDVPLPDGLLRRGRISYSDSTLPADTALRHIWWVNGDFSAHKIDLRDQLVAADDQTVEFSPRVTAMGPASENGFGEQLVDEVMGEYVIEDRFLRIDTSDTMPADKSITIWLEYFPYEAPYGSRDDGDYAFTQAPAI